MYLREFLCAMIALLAVWGAVGAVYMFALWLVRPKTDAQTVILLRMSGCTEPDIARVSYCLTRLSVSGDLRNTVIAAVFDDRESPSFSAAEYTFAEEPHVLVCDVPGFAEKFLN